MTATGSHQDAFFGPFQRIYEAHPDIPVHSYYDEPFHDYVGPAAWRQEWDIPTLTGLVQAEPPGVVLDLGSGEGRLTDRLLRSGCDYPVIGVDDNTFAAGRFQDRFAGSAGVRFAYANLVEDVLPACQTAVFASVTINSFTTTRALDSLFRNVYRVLDPDGALILLAYREPAVSAFTRLGRAIDAVEFETQNHEKRLIWRGVDFVDQELRQNYFIEHRGPTFPGVLGVLQEHVWLASEVAAAATDAGFDVNNGPTATVDEGGATDWVCDSLILRKTS